MTQTARARENLEALRGNPYPGRGIVIGQTPNSSNFVQVYWIMGRSENSRNRVLLQSEEAVRTAPFDPSKVKDPSLIIYNCARSLNGAHVVTNGDHTDTICEALSRGESFEAALNTRVCEPDGPHYTPRIAGLLQPRDPVHIYKLALVKAIDHDPERLTRQIFSFGRAIPGIGHMITTYRGDADPLPSFEGEPRPVEIPAAIEQTLDLFWSALNTDNRVALMVQFIEGASGKRQVKIANRHG